VSFSNLLKKFTVKLDKVDSETEEAQGDSSLDGALYGMFKGENLLDTELPLVEAFVELIEDRVLDPKITNLGFEIADAKRTIGAIKTFDAQLAR